MDDRADVYSRIIERVFFSRYHDGDEAVDWERKDLTKACDELGIRVPKNLGDVVYSFRYRKPLPDSVRAAAPEGRDWIIRGTGPATYRFEATSLAWVTPNQALAETKVPDATPGMVKMNALSDEQALVATS